jgi:hypothetical protein
MDGDCDYEREDQLLDNLVNNGFTEVYIYNVSKIFDQASIDVQVSGGNNPQEILTHEEHLARFITKAKKDYGLKVYAAISSVLTNEEDRPDLYDQYYSHQGDFGTKTLPSNISEVDESCDEYFQRQYVGEGRYGKSASYSLPNYFNIEDVDLFYPVDSAGKYSTYDKMMVDVANVSIYNERVENGAMENAASSINCGDIDPSNCYASFDGIVTEWEWWNKGNYADARLNEFIYLLKMIKCLNNSLYIDCKLDALAYQGWFEDNDWVNTSYTPQVRANYVDKYADKILLYTYKKHACATYEDGTGGNANRMFSNRAEYFSNNGFGSLTGNSTAIQPIFSSERCVVSEKNLECPQTAQYDQDERCDYYQNYSGAFIIDYNGYYNTSNTKIGIVERVFQNQYDFDDLRTSSSNTDNQITGYSWFKTNTLFSVTNNFSGKKALSSPTVSDRLQNLNVYPNPSQGDVWVKTNDFDQLYFSVFDQQGRVIVPKQKLTSQKISLDALSKGLYHVTFFDETDNSYKSEKILMK